MRPCFKKQKLNGPINVELNSERDALSVWTADRYMLVPIERN